ncbi:MAG: carbohydrate-binding domain-containing protein [Bacteroidales bacterium]|nr:carbohydrate-binding domain-containing protein [Bacteroidales bacterium]
MKKSILWPVAALLLLAVGCNKDNITVVSDTTSSGGGVDVSDVENIDTNYDRTVNVVFATAGATVSGTGDSLTATVSGNDVTIHNLGTEKVLYNVSGTTTDGFLKIYSDRKQAVRLDGASIKNTRGAAINVQGETTRSKGKRVDLILTGASTVADGSSYTLTPSDEDEKAAIFSEGQIIVSGSGSLTVNATGKSGITSDDYVAFLDGCTVDVSSSAGHGVRGKDFILVSGGTITVNVSANGRKGFSSDSLVRFEGGETTIGITGSTVVESGDTARSAGIKADQLFEMAGGSLTITNSGTGGKGISGDGAAVFSAGTVNVTVTGNNFGSSGGGWGGGWGGNNSNNSVGAKGIKFDGAITITGGTIAVTASKHEGIETKSTLTISGGQVYSQSSDDAINSASDMTISGGYVCAYSTGNDGLDANGDLYINGGVVYAIGASSPEVAIDANTEGGHKLYIQSGATIIAIGTLENGAQLSQSCYQASSWTRNVWYSMTVGNNTYAFKTPSSGGSRLVVSGPQQPSLKSNVTVSGGTSICKGMLNLAPETSGGSNVTLSNYSGGGGGGGWH